MELLNALGIDAQELMLNPMLLPAYAQTYAKYVDRLTPGFPVPGEVDLSIIGNNTLLEHSFSLRSMDRVPLHPVLYAGKSAHIAYTDDVNLACLTMLGRPAKREHRLYTVPNSALVSVGFNAVYAPTRNRLLHARLIPHHMDETGDIPRDLRIALVELLQAHQSPSRAARKLN